MNIIEKIDEYLNEDKDLIKRIKKMAAMPDSDEKDNIADGMIDEVIKKLQKMNSDPKVKPKEHNKNISNSKEIRNLISDILDSSNPNPLIKKVERLIKNFENVLRGGKDRANLSGRD